MKITIVSGDINSGKTSSVKKAYSKGQIDSTTRGFLAIKVYDKEQFLGYDLQEIHTGLTKPLMRFEQDKLVKTYLDKSMIGPFAYDKKTFEWHYHFIEEISEHHLGPILIDEVGKLELSGQGYNQIVTKLLKDKRDLILVVRKQFIKAVCAHYEINNPTIIDRMLGSK